MAEINVEAIGDKLQVAIVIGAVQAVLTVEQPTFEVVGTRATISSSIFNQYVTVSSDGSFEMIVKDLEFSGKVPATMYREWRAYVTAAQIRSTSIVASEDPGAVGGKKKRRKTRRRA